MPFSRPDVLVLAGGGLVGEAWMPGVLAGLEAAAGIDFRQCQCFVGTSAGSIVSAHLAAGRRPRRPRFPTADLPEEPPPLDASEERALAAGVLGGPPPAVAGARPGAAAAPEPLAAPPPVGGAP